MNLPKNMLKQTIIAITQTSSISNTNTMATIHSEKKIHLKNQTVINLILTYLKAH